MNRDPSPDSRLERIEARLARLEHLQEDARRHEQRARRRGFWTRIAFTLAVGGAYILYLRYALTIS